MTDLHPKCINASMHQFGCTWGKNLQLKYLSFFKGGLNMFDMNESLSQLPFGKLT